ncbi:pyrimidine reductase family protein [Mycolicibacterium stellerae]|uniref:pyrimidine reductase family protein n=1 Tax=Mycolicibacterium stellerae TaxID=2358193 RepID=UPI000F0BCD68|nr:pyrimidine reductase family protein [Mycolicibacterium stellerae]
MTNLTSVTDPGDLAQLYADAPSGVRANMIFSADGAAAFGGRAGTLSCPADQNLLRDLRAFADVVLVGAGTARAERYGPARFTEAQEALRGAHRGHAPPPIAVVSQSGRLPSTLFVDGTSPPFLVTSASAAQAHSLDSDPRWRLLVAGEDTVDVGAATKQLRALGMQRILCEGGPTLLDQLVDADAVDEICVTIAPLLAGSQPVGLRTPSRQHVPASLELRHALLCDSYLFLRYRRSAN